MTTKTETQETTTPGFVKNEKKFYEKQSFWIEFAVIMVIIMAFNPPFWMMLVGGGIYGVVRRRIEKKNQTEDGTVVE